MKRLITRSALMAGLVVGPMLAVLLLPVPYNHDLSAILNKRDLLKDGQRDRIIFVAGSGLYSALDSALVQERLGRPVRNIALWAGFAITPVLTEIGPYLRGGDTVVLVPEYGIAFDRYNETSRKWLFALAPGRNLLKLYGSIFKLKLFAEDMTSLVRSKVEALPQALREAMRTGNPGVFLREGYVQYDRFFNANGDSYRIFPAAASPEAIRQRGENYFSLPEYQGQSLTAVNAFCLQAAARGIRVFFVFPAYPREEYDRFGAGLRQYAGRLRGELACPILGTPEDFLYPYALFTDTIHHLGIEGKRRRTERMIELLSAALPPVGKDRDP
jgi:hypothetical protein